MARLLACPFCRELFPEGERTKCGACGLPLVNMDELPPSLDAQAEEWDELARIDPDDRRVGRFDWRRGKGALLVLCALGLAAFFTPWVALERPDIAELSGFDLARGRAGWLWGGAIGWFLLLPLVLTRRTPRQMRGVRVVSAAFAAMTLLEVIMLVASTPERPGYAFHWLPGLYASGAISLLGSIAASRFGGPRSEAARPLGATTDKVSRSGRRGSRDRDRGRVLH